MAMAQAYYNTLTPEQKAAVDATGGPTIAWLQNAINAGVPDAIAAAGGTTAGAGGGPGGAPAPTAGAVPDWGHREAELMTANYNRLVADGVPPAQAERIVRIAIGGVAHDYAANMAFDSALGGVDAEGTVNQYRTWDQFYDPNCPPDAPYHPDMNHMRQWFPWVPADAASKCVEKPHDVPGEYTQAPQQQSPAETPAETTPPAPEEGAAGSEAGSAGTGATPAPTE
jgi:hypothetical protein